MKSLRLLLVFYAAAAGAFAADEAKGRGAHPLKWDAMEKTVEAKVGDHAAEFVFKVTNTSDRSVTIAAARPSCGCTTVDLPTIPWVLVPGASGSLPATVDFTGKDGMLRKTIVVETSAGPQTLEVKIKLPPIDPEERRRNQAAAKADRQAVFRGDCMECHVNPAVGKKGEELFQAACLNCHKSTGRADMVPDLFTARTPRDAAWWRTWIAEGREGSLMPAFGYPRGILTEAEIESLVAFAMAKLPTEPRPN